MWLAIIGSFVGVMLLFNPDGHSADLLGRARRMQ
jgi:drug/metabolite transporter (DMT)-like permease